MIALVLGLSASLALWAFELGKELAGMDAHSAKEWRELQQDQAQLKAELDRVRALADTADAAMIAEKAIQQQLTTRIGLLEAENRRYRADLALFEQLIPSSGVDALAIRGMQARQQPEVGVTWQVLLVQSAKNAPEFKGQLELTLAGTHNQKPWQLVVPAAQYPVAMKQSLRVEGVQQVPTGVVVKSVAVRVLQGSAVKLTHSVKVG
jgi:hypothetical protein